MAPASCVVLPDNQEQTPAELTELKWRESSSILSFRELDNTGAGSTTSDYRFLLP